MLFAIPDEKEKFCTFLWIFLRTPFHFGSCRKLLVFLQKQKEKKQINNERWHQFEIHCVLLNIVRGRN